MSERNNDQRTSASALEKTDEGGLRAPPGVTGWRKAWWWFDFIVLVNLARLRFVAVLVLIGAIITKWDLLTAYYDKWTRPASAAGADGGEFEWFCPMHLSVVRDNSKEKCPICFMPLAKRKKGAAHEEVLPAGVVNRLQLSPYRVVLAGVGTWRLDYQPVSKEIKAAGVVEFNERGQRTVSARIAGRIDKLFVSETGQMVEADDKLASIYSPDLVVTVQNLLDAKRSGDTKNQVSAQRRLELLGIDDAQIRELMGEDQDRTHLTIQSPISGHVIKKYVREGQYVEQGSPLYDIADLSTVWIQAQVYEDDMQFLPLDQQHPGRLNQGSAIEIIATTRALSDEVFHGKLDFVYPHVDQNTRTVTIRCEVKNPGHKLRPGSTATVTLRVFPKNIPALVSATENSEQSAMLEQGRMLAVPESAVIDTGDQSIVYRETLPGMFEGVRVKLGPRMSGPEGENLFPVLDGLARGEQVVAAGSFLVDAETRLNPAAGSMYFGSSGGSKSLTTVRPTTPQDENASLTAALAKMPAEDRRIAEAQQFCPILQRNRLGSMGIPVKIMVEGQAVFLCCAGCKKSALANPRKTLATVVALKNGKHDPPSAEATPANSVEEAEIQAELAKLPKANRQAAIAQKFCVVLEENRLGSMGTPVKLTVEGQTVFVCCEGCQDEALANPKATLAKLAELKQRSRPASADGPAVSDEAKVAAELAKLSPGDRAGATAQKFCAVLDGSRLGLMGPPVKVMIDAQAVFLCCQDCKKQALANPKATLSKAADLKAQSLNH